jgi:hypothetical protein
MFRPQSGLKIAQKAFRGLGVTRVTVHFKPSLLLLICDTVLNFVTEYSNMSIPVYFMRTAEMRSSLHITRSSRSLVETLSNHKARLWNLLTCSVSLPLSSQICFPHAILQVNLVISTAQFVNLLKTNPCSSILNQNIVYLVQDVQLKSGPYFNMSNLFTTIFNMLYYTTNLYLH